MIPLQCGASVERRNAVHLPVKNSRIVRVIHARPARPLAGAVRFDQIVAVVLLHKRLGDLPVPVDFIWAIAVLGYFCPDLFPFARRFANEQITVSVFIHDPHVREIFSACSKDAS